MPIQSTSGLQSKIDTFRTAEAARFRQTLDERGALQKAAGAGGVKGKLVAWVLASPGREGTLAGRGVKALVNLFGKGNFEAVSSALQASRETSVNNLFNAILRHGERELDADFSRRFSDVAGRQKSLYGTNFSARDFTGLQQTMKDLAAEQYQARQDAIAAVQQGRPTDKMKTLGQAEMKFAARVLSPANDGGQAQISKFPDDVDGDKFNAVARELNTMSTQLREHLNKTMKIPGEGHTVEALKQEGRQDDDFHLQQARAEVQKRVSAFRESYVGALESLAQKQAAPQPAATQAPPHPAATETPAPSASALTDKQQLRQELNALHLQHTQALSEFESNKQIYEDVKRTAHEKRGTDGELTAGERDKVESYRKLAEESKNRVLQLREQLVKLDRQLAAR